MPFAPWQKIPAETTRLQIKRSILHISACTSVDHLHENVQGVIIDESNSPDGKKWLSISHNQPGIGFFEISVICNFCQKSECIAFSLHYARALASVESAVGVIIGTKSGKADHLILVLAAAAVMMMLGWFLTMTSAIVLAITVAMIVMDIMARM